MASSSFSFLKWRCAKTFAVVVLATALLATTANANGSPKYASLCDSVFCKIVETSYSRVGELRGTVDEGACVPELGMLADQICNSALEQFSQEAPLPDDDKQNEALYDKKIDELEKLIDAPLHVVYLKQLSLLREKALKTFKQALLRSSSSAPGQDGSAQTGDAGGTEFDAMMQADEYFRKEAEDATRTQNPDWSYAAEKQALKSALLELAQRSRKVSEVKLQAAKQTQQAMQYLQMQQQQLQAIQQQVQGSYSPWNIGAAYRIPDSNINLSCSYQQGRGSIQLSCVPDESASLLGPNGFVNGVTPGNIGVSFNMNI